jgi:hypothetical protein
MYICTHISAQDLNLVGGKTTALIEPGQADQWEEGRPSNLNRDASLASNIMP